MQLKAGAVGQVREEEPVRGRHRAAAVLRGRQGDSGMRGSYAASRQDLADERLDGRSIQTRRKPTRLRQRMGNA